LNKLEFPSPKNNVYQVWLILACWFWRRRFFNNFSVFLLFCYYLPLEKGYPFPLNKFEFLSPKDELWQVWLKLVQWFWRRSWKCKSLQTDRQTQMAARQWAIRKLTWAFSSGELKSRIQFLFYNTFNTFLSNTIMNLFLRQNFCQW
jgi:hypothetical protein